MLRTLYHLPPLSYCSPFLISSLANMFDQVFPLLAVSSGKERGESLPWECIIPSPSQLFLLPIQLVPELLQQIQHICLRVSGGQIHKVSKATICPATLWLLYTPAVVFL